jgi:hypothetical protein
MLRHWGWSLPLVVLICDGNALRTACATMGREKSATILAGAWLTKLGFGGGKLTDMVFLHHKCGNSVEEWNCDGQLLLPCSPRRPVC